MILKADRLRKLNSTNGYNNYPRNISGKRSVYFVVS